MIRPIEEIIAREWPTIRDRLAPMKPLSPEIPPIPGEFWEPRIFPGIPVTWPPQKGLADLDFYASAAGRNLSQLIDGEYYSNPWGRVRADLRVPRFDFQLLTEAPVRAGIQGVRPLLKEEVQILGDSVVQVDLASALADGMLSPELAVRVRAYYGLFFRNHGVGSAIRLLHPAFSDWVCRPVG